MYNNTTGKILGATTGTAAVASKLPQTSGILAQLNIVHVALYVLATLLVWSALYFGLEKISAKSHEGK